MTSSPVISESVAELAVQWKDLECRFGSIQNSIDDRVSDLKKKEQHFEWKNKFLKQKLKEIESKSLEIELRKDALETEKKELDDRLVDVDQTYQLVAMCHARAEETSQALEKKLQKVKSKEKRLVSKLKGYERNEKRLIVKRKLMKRKFELLKDWSDELVFREKRLDDCVSELNLSGGKLNSIERGLLDKFQLFEAREKVLEETENDLKRQETSFREKYKGFYGGNSEEDFDLSIVRRSCIMLLEQLTELEPQIGIKVRERARLLAVEWKARMKSDSDQNLEVVGFLHLDGAYRLTEVFDKHELAMSIATIAHHRRVPELCRRLKLEHKIHDIVLHLIQDNRAVEAVKLIHEFYLMDALPPAPILRNYLESIATSADNTSTLDSTKEQDTNMIVSALVTVIQCIKEFKLDSEYPTESLEEKVLDLQRKRECFSSSTKLTTMKVLSNSVLTSDYANCNLSPIRHPVSSNCTANLVSPPSLPP